MRKLEIIISHQEKLKIILWRAEEKGKEFVSSSPPPINSQVSWATMSPPKDKKTRQSVYPWLMETDFQSSFTLHLIVSFPDSRNAWFGCVKVILIIVIYMNYLPFMPNYLTAQ